MVGKFNYFFSIFRVASEVSVDNESVVSKGGVSVGGASDGRRSSSSRRRRIETLSNFDSYDKYQLIMNEVIKRYTCN